MKGMKFYNRSTIYVLALLTDFHKQQKLERLAGRLGVTYAAE